MHPTRSEKDQAGVRFRSLDALGESEARHAPQRAGAVLNVEAQAAVAQDGHHEGPAVAPLASKGAPASHEPTAAPVWCARKTAP